jgi:hypothetical protein
MMRRAVFLLVLFVVPCIYAQSAVDMFNRPGSIKVRVTSKGAGTCDLRASVSLVNGSGTLPKT